MSDHTFVEIYQTFTRSKFDKYVSLEKRLNFIGSLRQKAEMVNITEIITTCRDPKAKQIILPQSILAHLQKWGQLILVVVHRILGEVG